mmetsp:Transcript_79749/g.125858  ORF Transcript_79749/g.125858 Transcript_79749/m.125858 type:complete len:114 (+) Transcript_79749:182-523(+)
MLSESSRQCAAQYMGEEKTRSLEGQKLATTLVDSDGANCPEASVNQKVERKRVGIRHSYEMGISDTFFTAQTIVEAMPEHVGGNVTLSCPLQKDSCGRHARPETRIIFGWLSK